MFTPKGCSIELMQTLGFICTAFLGRNFELQGIISSFPFRAVMLNNGEVVEL